MSGRDEKGNDRTLRATACEITRRDMLEKVGTVIGLAGLGAISLPIIKRTMRGDLTETYAAAAPWHGANPSLFFVGPTHSQRIAPHPNTEAGIVEVNLDAIPEDKRAVCQSNFKKAFNLVLMDLKNRGQLYRTKMNIIAEQDMVRMLTTMAGHELAQSRDAVLASKPGVTDGFTTAILVGSLLQPKFSSMFLTAISSDIFLDVARLIATFDHEAGHVLDLLQGIDQKNRAYLEVQAYKAGIQRQRSIEQLLLASKHLSDLALAKRLEGHTIPEHSKRLASWQATLQR